MPTLSLADSSSTDENRKRHERPDNLCWRWLRTGQCASSVLEYSLLEFNYRSILHAGRWWRLRCVVRCRWWRPHFLPRFKQENVSRNGQYLSIFTKQQLLIICVLKWNVSFQDSTRFAKRIQVAMGDIKDLFEAWAPSTPPSPPSLPCTYLFRSQQCN